MLQHLDKQVYLLKQSGDVGKDTISQESKIEIIKNKRELTKYFFKYCTLPLANKRLKLCLDLVFDTRYNGYLKDIETLGTCKYNLVDLYK